MPSHSCGPSLVDLRERKLSFTQSQMPLAKDGMVAMFEERDLPTLDKSDPQRLFRASIFLLRTPLHTIVRFFYS